MSSLGTIQKSVLVVEGHQNLRKMLHEVLEHRGFEIISAYDRADALRALRFRNRRVDLALIDVRLFDASGLDLASTLWRRWPGLSILFMSRFGERLTPEEAESLINLDVLRKPFDLDELVSRVEGLVGQTTIPPAHRTGT